jgi:hypothetical protein
MSVTSEEHDWSSSHTNVPGFILNIEAKIFDKKRTDNVLVGENLARLSLSKNMTNIETTIQFTAP